MSADIIQLADVRARRFNVAFTEPAPVAALDTGARFHFWTGTSGKRYVHTVYSIFDCPAIATANYVLVKRQGVASRKVLAVGRISGSEAAANLAEIRQRGANLGADEVHVHLLATTESEALAVECDLRSAQFAAAGH